VVQKLGFLHNPNPGSTEYEAPEPLSDEMEICVQISGYTHDGEGWSENQPYQRIILTVGEMDTNRVFGRKIAKAVRAAGWHGRLTEPFGSLQEYQPAMFKGSTLGLYWYPV
jgi:hypothetical protein